MLVEKVVSQGPFHVHAPPPLFGRQGHVREKKRQANQVLHQRRVFRTESEVPFRDILMARKEAVGLIECKGFVSEAKEDLQNNESAKSDDDNAVRY